MRLAASALYEPNSDSDTAQVGLGLDLPADT
jgi:hypothetical protein